MPQAEQAFAARVEHHGARLARHAHEIGFGHEALFAQRAGLDCVLEEGARVDLRVVGHAGGLGLRGGERRKAEQGGQ